MKYLIDTHILIWFLEGDEKLRDSHRVILENPQHGICLSEASLWEMAIKISLKKLEMNTNFSSLNKLLMDLKINCVPITFPHFQTIVSMPHHHGDPFDRMIIAQAIVEGMPILTADYHFQAYGVELVN